MKPWSSDYSHFDVWPTFPGVRPIQVMDNELAKELKQAGFPQSIHYNERGVVDFLETDANGKTHIVSVPTLEELLETCGAAFHSVGRVSFAPFLARSQISGWSDAHRSSCPPLASPSGCKT